MWQSLKELIDDMRAAWLLNDLEAGKYDHLLDTLPPEKPLDRPKRFSELKEFDVEAWMRRPPDEYSYGLASKLQW